MNVVLLGATGKVGGPILAELLERGHAVTAVVRDVSRLPAESAALAHRVGDAFDPAVLDDVLPGADAVICSVALRDPAQRERTPELLLRTVGAAAARAGVRLLTMGGAGSLRTATGVDLVDTPGFPEVAKPESLGFRAALHELIEHAPAGLDWTMLSPPASIEVAGPRTGRYRTADDTLLTDETGASRISASDLAAALVDELENPKHPGRRFTAGY